MVKNKKLIIFFVIIMFFGCKENKSPICFSFEQIQEIFYKEINKDNWKCLCPFYIDKIFFDKIEIQLNELVSKSDYCSLLICINPERSLLQVRALYNIGTEIYFAFWDHNGDQYQLNVKSKSAKKILKSKPNDFVIIDDFDPMIFDTIFTYIVKKNGELTYYYANNYNPITDDYKLLIDLFSECYANKKDE